MINSYQLTTTMKLFLISLCMVLTGCASTTKDAQMHYSAQADHNAKQLAAARPLLVLEAHEGQTIELKGVKRFEINAPQSANQQAFVPYVAPRNPWLDLANTVVSGGFALAGQHIGANGTAKIVGAVGAVGTSGFNALRDFGVSSVTSLSDMQPNITNNGGVVNGGSVTGPNSGANSGNSGRIGNDTIDTRTTTTTTTTNTTLTSNISCNAGSAGNGGPGTTGTNTIPGVPGGPGGTSGPVNCNPVLSPK